MPRLAPMLIEAQALGRARFSHRYEASVFSDGMFEVVVPDEQLSTIRSLLDAIAASASGKSEVTIASNKADKTVLQSTRLDAIKDVLQSHAQAMIRTDEEIDLVIVYARTAHVRYVVDAEGKVHPNGRLAGEGYAWNEATPVPRSFSDRHVPYSVGLTARVVRRIVHVQHATGTFHTESFPPEARELGPMGTALNEFIDTPMPTSDFWSTTQKGEPRAGHGRTGLQIVPYTEESAAFFVRTMTRLCEMAEAMDRFMGDGPEDLAMSIATGTSAAIAAID